MFFQSRQATQYFDFLCEEAQRENNETATVAHLLSLLLLELHREIRDEKFLRLSNRDNMLTRDATSQNPIAAAAQYLETNYEERITIASLSRRVGISRSQLAAQFHCTIVQYFTRKRLEAACDLLRETEWTISYITRFVGLRSPPHFHTLFKRRYNYLPGEFRENAFLIKAMSDDRRH